MCNFACLLRMLGKRVAGIAWLALAVFSAGPAQASNLTSATLNGAVVDVAGSPVPGAKIVVLHEPSGSRKTGETNEQGSFFRSGLRVGGPYRIEVSAPGYPSRTLENLFFKPGTQPLLRITLEGATRGSIEEVYVTAQALSSDISNGVGSEYDSTDISNQPATRRDVIRTLIRDPLANSSGEGNLSVAGVNPRFNGLAIDGALQQDDFGLGSNTYATERSPINIDAIESASVVASDYSVVVSGFTGGLVNLTTKSGTNEWDGSVFYYYQDEDYIGDTVDGDLDFSPGEFEEEEYGFTLGGPIVKDRLFFFLSYDEYESASSEDFRNFDENNGIAPEFFDTLRQLTIDNYGFDPGTRPGTANTPVTSERLLTKFDWNISENHRASFTYQSTEETGVSVDANELTSSWYDIPVELEAYTGQLFSDWSPRLSTTLRLNFKEFSRGQICQAGPEVGELVLLEGADLSGTPLEGLATDLSDDIIFGCDRFRHANDYSDERLQLFASADYQLGDHLITFGGEYEEFDLFNLFLERSRGRFQFNSAQAFIAGIADVDYQNVPSNNALDGAAEWGYDKYTAFIQDTWQLRVNLELTLGLRYERYSQDESPAFSQQVLNSYGVNSTANLDGAELFLPRIGFRWDAAERTTVTGGFGRFAGGEPKVWISNAFQAPTVIAESESALTGVDPFSVPGELQSQVAQGTPVPIDVISEGFDVPSDWKASLRVDQDFNMRLGGLDLGDNYRLTVQYLYTRMEDGFLWSNLAQTSNAAALPTGVAPDGRPIYADLTDLGILNLTQLENGDGADSHVFSIALGKTFDNGLSFQLSYAYQDTEVLSEGTSSRGISNWRGIVAADRNNPQARTSPFQIEHAFKVSLGYEKEFFRGLKTRVDLFGQLLKENPYTATFNVRPFNSLFGSAGAREFPFDNSPLYVPTGPDDPLVGFASDFDREAFFAYLSAKDLDAGIQTVNGSGGNWNNIWDLRIQQELPGIPGLDKVIGDNNFKLQLDIENVLNLINDEWGVYNNGPRFGQLAAVSADLVSVADVSANGIDAASALTGDSMRTTCQASSDCIYRFNSFRDLDTGQTSFSRSVYRIRLGIRMDF